MKDWSDLGILILLVIVGVVVLFSIPKLNDAIGGALKQAGAGAGNAAGGLISGTMNGVGEGATGWLNRAADFIDQAWAELTGSLTSVPTITGTKNTVDSNGLPVTINTLSDGSQETVVHYADGSSATSGTW